MERTPDHPYPVVAGDRLGWLSTDDMIEVDRVMIDELRIELVQMMENAGRNLALLAARLTDPKTAVVVSGRGGNGGGGLVAARHLVNRGVDVTVVLTRPAERFSGVPGHQLEIVRRMGIPTVAAPLPSADVLGELLATADVIVDAAIGYSLRGPPSGDAATAIEAIAIGGRSVVALDAPSGLDTTTGSTPGVCVRADATLTLAAPKRGLRGSPEVGRLFVGDISVPPAVIERLGHAAPVFRACPILAVDP